MRLGAVLLILAGCDDHLFPSVGGAPPTSSGWCGVQQLFANECVSCHGPGGSGGLDLKGDPHGALVSVNSVAYPGSVRVIPGDPAGSLLYQKITATQGDKGLPMPPGGSVNAASAEIVRAWILSGAPADCATTPTGTGGRYHPEGRPPLTTGSGRSSRSRTARHATQQI